MWVASRQPRTWGFEGVSTSRGRQYKRLVLASPSLVLPVVRRSLIQGHRGGPLSTPGCSCLLGTFSAPREEQRNAHRGQRVGVGERSGGGGAFVSIRLASALRAGAPAASARRPHRAGAEGGVARRDERADIRAVEFLERLAAMTPRPETTCSSAMASWLRAPGGAGEWSCTGAWRRSPRRRWPRPRTRRGNKPSRAPGPGRLSCTGLSASTC